jgi:peptidoglycan/LPS O-acetylase OafA/YrhL
MQPTTKAEPQGRNTWIEILRLFLMFLIVVGHSYVHGSGYNLSVFNASELWGVFFSSFGRFAVLVFFLISGCFETKANL